MSIGYLQKGVVHVGITYHAAAEHTAVTSKVADRVEYVWRDHWMLVGMMTSTYTFISAIAYGLFPMQVLAIDDQESD